MAIDMNLFEQGVNRENTGCVKWDGRGHVFGRADVIPMWVADMDFATPACVTDAIIKRAQHGAFGYCEGDPADKQAVIDWMARRHSVKVTADDVMFSPGVIDSMETAIGALKAMGKGNSVAMFTPVYGPFYGSTRQNKMEIKGCKMIHEGADWKMDLNALEEIFKGGTKILLFCNPHNPVGRVWSREEMEQLVALTRRYGVTIISDEIHGDLEMPGCKHTCMLNVEPSSITFVSATKTFNLAALRHSSVLITDPELKEQVKAEFARRGNGGINMFGRIAQTAAYQGGEEWLDALLGYLADTRDMVEKFLAEELPEVTCARLQGTYLMWLDFRSLGLSQEELVKLMVEKAGVGFSSGTDFGPEGAGYMRMNIATPRSNVIRALQQVKAALKG